jgi:stage II sporulation protein M
VRRRLDGYGYQLKKELERTWWMLGLNTFFFIAGIFGGALSASSLSEGAQSQSAQAVAQTVDVLRQFVPAGKRVMTASMGRHLIGFALIWVSGAFVFLYPLSAAVLSATGFLTGFTVAYLVQMYGARGFLYSAVGILPQSLLLVPFYMVISTRALEHSIVRLRDIRYRVPAPQQWEAWWKYSLRMVLMLVWMLAGCLLHAVVSPWLVKILS